ncbi:restriction endonuclease [Yersinia enterocolitica]|nr:restriction endonuclease [Yersinia enterocolitica]
MFIFCGEISFKCKSCEYNSSVDIADFTVNCVGSSERSMGAENLHEILYDFNCPKCGKSISLEFEASEYPIETISFIINRSSGADTEGNPYIEYLAEIYRAEDIIELYRTIPELINSLKVAPDLIRDIPPREFEEVVAEIFKKNGFIVELTKRTRDGGKDIIAVKKDSLGIPSKYFIECKRYAKENKISVDIVRSLYGVKNTKNGPNKAILVTTSSFTPDARKFVENEATSEWDMTLIDYYKLLEWINEY